MSIAVIGFENFSLLSGEGYAQNDFGPFKILTVLFYQYVLNFPLSFFNWFTDKYLYTTYYFIFPNSLAMAYIVSRLIPVKKKEANKYMTWILIPFGILVFTILGYSFLMDILSNN